VPPTLLPTENYASQAGESGVRAAQLGETLRRAGRVLQPGDVDCTLLFEAGLRAAGLRDATEAARAAHTCFRLLPMQLPSRWV
jgi:hypothetical protein